MSFGVITTNGVAPAVEPIRRARLRVLVITRLFPNALEPLSAPFNRQQFAALGRLCHLEVMATIPWFPAARVFRRWSNAGALEDVPARDVIDGLSVVHPRVLFVPRIGAGLSGALEIASLLPGVARRRHDVDVVLGSWAYPDGVAAVALARVLGVPAVIKTHGSDLNVIGAMRGPRANLVLALPRAARVVAVSEALADKVASFGVDRARIAVVHNGVDRSHFHVRDRRLARRFLGWAAAGRMVLYCGRLEREKGVFELVEAFGTIAGTHPDLSLVLIGDGSARGQLESMARRFAGRMHLLGSLPLERVPMWMAASSLVTLPSHNEGSPNVVREALACGRPVVATAVGGIPELITSPLLGAMVPARDPTALARAIADVAGRPCNPETIASSSGGSWKDSAAALLAILQRAHREHLP
jgi:teichuronic acid biosynthesis glycosyltransferase TuaC